jgi:hypothetical protein
VSTLTPPTLDERRAPIVTRRPNPRIPGFTLVQVRCPWCGKLHQHGVPDVGAFAERAPHCRLTTRTPPARSQFEYLIVEPTRAEILAEQQRAHEQQQARALRAGRRRRG